MTVARKSRDSSVEASPQELQPGKNFRNDAATTAGASKINSRAAAQPKAICPTE